MYKKAVFVLSLAGFTINCFANQNTQYNCQLISGKIIKAPRNPLFKFTKAKKYSSDNYPMTHTQFFIQSDNGDTHKIIVDNLFYKYTTPQQASSNEEIDIINDFNHRYKVGDSVSACGKTIDKNDKLSMHFVHPSNCTSTPFNGFLRINGQDITNNRNYCNACSCK